MNINQKGFANIILVVVTIIIMLVGVVGYFVFVKKSAPIPAISSETANWKIYRNEFYRFEFKYPEKYQISDWGPTAKGTPQLPISNAIFVQAPQADGGAVNVFGIIVPDRTFIQKSGEDYIHFITKPGVCGSGSKEIERLTEYIGINNYSGEKVTEVFRGENKTSYYIYYCIAHPVNPLIIFTPQEFVVGEEDEDIYYANFNEIFTTFKFFK